ncbi:RTA1 like protein-domain-containing protein [Lasiosphaeria miniovina]|uniref:RTA1 like protein-domain-containing protein n=1 Tax=Lasiosphaeria miniovina TaxID=1954250 RepID=A0AA40E2J5_9PEZI|nr:RTA1 like protein-domain-containing protein [Lasiosphaeria miniovina]KAK0722617.1 RTA1 like protein-domain-containing protein [Lasiosphaeria miniovina]
MAAPIASPSAEAAGAESLDFALYRYKVSLPAAIAAVGVFFILSLLHVWRIYRHRSFYFTAFTVGGFFQAVGYCGRVWSHFDDTAIGAFVIQAILILVAPALYAASIYMILGRLIRVLHAEQLSIIPVRWMTKMFVIGDVLSFFLQAGGGGIQAAGTLELYDIGEKIIIVGLFVQICMFGFFLVTTVAFHLRFRQAKDDAARQTPIPWKRHLTVLYVVSAVIMVRSLFRVVEYLQGNKGFLISHEIFLYMFDAVLMATVMAIFFTFYVDDLGVSQTGKRGSGMEMLSSRGSGIEMLSKDSSVTPA